MKLKWKLLTVFFLFFMVFAAFGKNGSYRRELLTVFFYFLWCSQPSSKVDNCVCNTFVLFNFLFNSLFNFLFNSRNLNY